MLGNTSMSALYGRKWDSRKVEFENDSMYGRDEKIESLPLDPDEGEDVPQFMKKTVSGMSREKFAVAGKERANNYLHSDRSRISLLNSPKTTRSRISVGSTGTSTTVSHPYQWGVNKPGPKVPIDYSKRRNRRTTKRTTMAAVDEYQVSGGEVRDEASQTELGIDDIEAMEGQQALEVTSVPSHGRQSKMSEGRRSRNEEKAMEAAVAATLGYTEGKQLAMAGLMGNHKSKKGRDGGIDDLDLGRVKDWVDVLNESTLFSGGEGATKPHWSLPEIDPKNVRMTVTSWFRLTEKSIGHWRCIFTKGEKEPECNLTPSLWLRPESRRVTVCITSEDSVCVDFSSQAAIRMNDWTHVAVTIGDNNIALYINGKEDSRTSTRGAVKLNQSPIYIAKDPWNHGFVGDIAELRVYPRCLSHHEVAAEYLVPPYGIEVRKADEEWESRGLPQSAPPARSVAQERSFQDSSPVSYAPSAIALSPTNVSKRMALMRNSHTYNEGEVRTARDIEDRSRREIIGLQLQEKAGRGRLAQIEDAAYAAQARKNADLDRRLKEEEFRRKRSEQMRYRMALEQQMDGDRNRWKHQAISESPTRRTLDPQSSALVSYSFRGDQDGNRAMGSSFDNYPPRGNSRPLMY